MNPNAPASRYRWIICTLLFFATAINYIDRQILSLLKPILDSDLHWSATQFGAINSAFQASYGVSLFLFGWLIDRFGTKIGYAVSISAWSLSAIAHAVVNSIGGFFGVRIALGLSEGGNFPGAIKAVAEWFPQKERALATALFNSGANVGAIAAPALVPPLALAFGWHWPFILAGLAGLVWVAAWIPLYGAPGQCRRVSAEELAHITDSDGIPREKAGHTITLGELLRHREAWSVIVAKLLTDPIWWFLLIWLPDFFKKTRGMDIKSSAVLLIAIYGIVTVLSIGGGWLSGYLANRGWSVTRARKTCLLLFALCVVPVAFVTQVGDWTAVFLIGLAGAAHQAWSANIYTTISDLFPEHAVARLTGISGTAGSIGGMVFPLATGALLDHFSNGYAIAFGWCAMSYLLAFALNHLLAPRFTRVHLPESDATAPVHAN